MTGSTILNPAREASSDLFFFALSYRNVYELNLGVCADVEKQQVQSVCSNGHFLR